MNNYDYPFNRPGYWNGCVPPNENGTVIVRSANARDGEDANGEEDVSSLRNSPSESSLFFYHTDHLGSTNLVTDRGRHHSGSVYETKSPITTKQKISNE